MNYRQWKKQYKKKYGYNPPIEKDKRKLSKCFRNSIDLIIDRTIDIAMKLPGILEEVKTKMSEMSDDEYLKFLSNVDDPYIKEIALKMRMVGGN